MSWRPSKRQKYYHPQPSAVAEPVDIADEHAERQVWLVKVPAHVGKAIAEAEDGVHLGHVDIDDGKVSMSVLEEILGGDVPLVYDMTQSTGYPPSGVLMEDLPGEDEDPNDRDANPARMRPMEHGGIVSAKFDVTSRNQDLEVHSHLYRARMKQATTKRHTTEAIDLAAAPLVGAFQDTIIKVAAGESGKATSTANAANSRKRRHQETRARLEESELENLIMELYERQRFYTRKELVHHTDQPEGWLFKKVDELCVLVGSKYELRPEYKTESMRAMEKEDEEEEGEEGATATT